jgi:hypothetical protein
MIRGETGVTLSLEGEPHYLGEEVERKKSKKKSKGLTFSYEKR